MVTHMVVAGTRVPVYFVQKLHTLHLRRLHKNEAHANGEGKHGGFF